MPGAAAGKRRETFHVTRKGNVEAIRSQGFHGKTRVETSGGRDYGGSVFGAGTYFHSDKKDSDKWLEGARAFEWGDEVQLRAQAKLKNPLTVRLPGTGPEADMAAYVREMRRIGALKPGETYGSNKLRSHDVGPVELTKRLQALGYDGVDIRASRSYPGAEGNQLLIFDPKNVRLRPNFKTEKVIKLKKDTTANPYPGGKMGGMSKPNFPTVRGTLDKKVRAVEGLEAYTVKGGTRDGQVAVFKDGKIAGYVRKRSGSSTRALGAGRSQTIKNAGYAYFSPDGKQLGTASTQTAAFSSIKLRPER